MGNYTIRESAAGAVAVQSDILDQAGNSIFKYDDRPRIIKRIGVTGSAVIGDAYVDVYFGFVFIGRYYPTTIGVTNPLEARDMMPFTTGLAIRGGQQLRIIVGKISVTNPFVITMEVVEFGSP